MEPACDQLKSEQILDELKRRQRTKEIVNVEEEQVKVVVFVCGENRYSFYGADIREIIPKRDISWVPGLPDYILGLINIRGDIESVIDIRHFIGEKNAVQDTHMIAMAVKGDFHTGVMIDVMEDVVDIPVSMIHPPLATLNGTARDLVIGEIEYGGKTISLLDVGRLASLIMV